MKKLLLFTIFICLLLSSCSYDDDGRILQKLDKHLDEYSGYRTELQMKTIMDNKESEYRMKESYTLGNKYMLKILEPSESKGIVIEYDGDKIHINNATIKQSITLSSVKNFDQGLLIGKFFSERDKIKSIHEEEVNGVKYYVFFNKVTDKDKYNHEQIIWLRKKDFVPYMMHITDSNNNPRVIIKYDDFAFTKN